MAPAEASGSRRSSRQKKAERPPSPAESSELSAVSEADVKPASKSKRKPKKAVAKTVNDGEGSEVEEKPKPARKRGGKAAKAEGHEGVEEDAKPKRKRKPKAAKAEGEDGEEAEPKPKRRKKANKLDFSAVTFPPRHFGSKKLVGAHTSAAGGAHFAVVNALKIGGRAFGVFTKNQKQWAAKPLEEDTIKHFKQFSNGLDIEGNPLADGKGIDAAKSTVCHCAYLVNLSAPNKDEWNKSFEAFVIEAQRCDELGIGFLVFHPGSNKGQCTREEAIANIARGINQAHEKTKDVVILVENMAGSNNVMGGSAEELAAILAKVDNKERVGICFDTCHAFASGSDLRTPEKYDEVMELYDKTVGLKNIKAFHINDSKADLGAHRDLHQNIGCGYLGLQAFALLLADERFDGRPFILETPMLDGTLNPDGAGGGLWTAEIQLLYRLEQLGGRSEKPLLDDPEVAKLFKLIKDSVDSSQKKKEEKAAADKEAKAKARAEKKAAKQNGEDGDGPAKKQPNKGKGKAKQDDDEEMEEPVIKEEDESEPEDSEIDELASD